ncbi:uncharacterized protein TA11935 [Theileria annulata]|uniref:SfiI-subtelomeric related protein family member n=1 Tax=Theileria annulata TaxID=5874 RepID=Q4UDR6_THEAN|nr:uncharacterized protein TA11935 [Theileria annulata]CAI74773.1 hypothetical protein TA11935 [Theileria annulata]|eukprot:XP_952505.1 hypothetical protein TA11935 [Theileria annulata]
MNYLSLKRFIIFFIFLNKCVTSIEVDLNNVPEQHCSITSGYTDGPLNVRLFILYLQPHVTVIREGETIIWSSTLLAERAIFFELYEIYEEKSLLFINSQHFYGNDFYRYEKVGDEWFLRTSEEFGLLVNCAHEDRLLFLDREMDHVTFNISDEDVYGTMSTVFITNQKYNLVGIYDDDQTIWEANNLLDKCGFVKVRGFQGNYELLYANILNEYTIEELFCHKNEGVWETVTKDRYYELLNEMILQEEQE